jgi:plasmid stability protein
MSEQAAVKPMTDLAIQVEDDVRKKLLQRARSHGRSTEEEAREIIRNAVEHDEVKPVGLGTLLAERFRGIGVEEEIPELRGHPVVPIEFDP